MTSAVMSTLVYADAAETSDVLTASHSTESETVPVTVKALEALVIYPETRVSANVISLNHADISVEQSGVVRAIKFEVGTQVKQGDVLIELDCRDATFQQKLAQSAQSLASKEWRRAQKLNSSQTIPEQQFNQARAAFEQASVQLKQAQLQVERCVLSAPYDGVVTARQVQLGATLSPAMPALRLLQQDRVEGSAFLTQAQIKQIASNKALVFEAEGDRYPVRLRVTQAFVGPLSRQQEIRFEFLPSNSDSLPLVGATGWLQWQASEPHLPANLVVERGAEHGFFSLDDSQARFVPLTKFKIGHPAEVNIADLKRQVIIDGRYRLADGDMVNISSD